MIYVNTNIVTPQLSQEPVDILLVEDNPGDVRLTREALKTANFETRLHVATNGEEALEFLRERTEDETIPCPDLLLLDLDLPRLDGFAVLERLEDDPAYPPIPVLVLTSSDAEEEVIRSYDRAANAYLTKPNGPDEFRSLVKAVKEFWIDSVQLPPTTTY